MIRSLSAIAISIMLIHQPAGAQVAGSCPNDNKRQLTGICWRTLTPHQKNSLLFGIWTGINFSNIAQRISRRDAQATFNQGFLPPDGSTVRDIVSWIDEFYRHNSNAQISLSNVYLISAIAIRGDDSNDVASATAFFRRNARIPTSGYIRFDHSREFFVREFWDFLISRADRNATQQQDERWNHLALAAIEQTSIRDGAAFDILDGLSKGFYISASAPLFNNRDKCTQMTVAHRSNLTFTFSYELDLFDASGRLNAFIEIPKQDFCIGEKYIAIESATRSFGRNLTINEIFLGCKLVRPASADPLWSEDRRNMYSAITAPWTEYSYPWRLCHLMDEVREAALATRVAR